MEDTIVIPNGSITFLYPTRLYWIIAILIFSYLVFVALKKHEKIINNFINIERQKEIFKGLNWSHIKKQSIMIGACLVFAIFAVARPQWGEHEEERKTTGLDILVAVDVSNSMEAEDVIPTRLKRSKYVLKLLADRVNGDRLGLVAFAGNAQVVSPLTTDIGYFKDTIESLSPDMVANQGTDLGAAIETSIKTLNRGAEEGLSSENTNTGSKVLLLVTDGEDNENTFKNTLEEVKKSGTKLFVFGVGTDKGSPIPIRDPNGLTAGYKRTKQGEVVMTKFSPDKLREITSQVSGKFWNIGNGESEVESFLREIDSLSKGERKEKKIKIKEERFQYPLFISVLFLLLSLFLFRSKK